MKEDYDRYLKEEMSAELKRNEEKKIYHQELDKQIEEQEKKKQEAYEEFLREKIMIDEIVKKIYEEDQMLVILNFYYLFIFKKATHNLHRQIICMYLFHID